MSHTSGIYQIRNIINGHIYIGSTIDIQKRWSSHVRLLNNNTHHSRHLQNAWNKYGEQAFEFSVLLQVDDVSSLLDIEQEFLDERAPEYNMSPTAGSSLGVKCTEETKRNISAAKKGKPGSWLGKHHTAETKHKLSEARKGQPAWNKGGHATEEQKHKLSEASKGKYLSEETKHKISTALKGELNPMFGKLHGEEAKRKMSESRKALGLSGNKSATSMPVNQFSTNMELIATFVSITEAAKLTGIDISHIAKVCKGIYKTAGGFIWRYAEMAAV